MTESESTVVVLPPIGNGVDAVRALELERAGIRAPRIPLFPGQGGAPRRAGATFADHADEVAAAHDGPLHVIALAIGAYTAAELLLRHPHRVASLVIACSSPGPVADEARARDAARGSQALETGMAPLVEQTIGRWFTPAAVAADHPGVRYARARLAAMEPAAWNDMWSAISRRSTVDADAAAQVAVPVSVVVPLHDAAGAALTLPPLHRQFPRSRLVYVDGPHMLGLERPENLLAAVDGHVAWLAEGGERIDHPLTWTGS